MSTNESQALKCEIALELVMVSSVSSWSLELRVVKLLYLANFEVSELRV
jgi:hypothetical protein